MNYINQNPFDSLSDAMNLLPKSVQPKIALAQLLIHDKFALPTVNGGDPVNLVTPARLNMLGNWQTNYKDYIPKPGQPDASVVLTPWQSVLQQIGQIVHPEAPHDAPLHVISEQLAHFMDNHRQTVTGAIHAFETQPTH